MPKKKDAKDVVILKVVLTIVVTITLIQAIFGAIQNNIQKRSEEKFIKSTTASLRYKGYEFDSINVGICRDGGLAKRIVYFTAYNVKHKTEGTHESIIFRAYQSDNLDNQWMTDSFDVYQYGERDIRAFTDSLYELYK